MTGESTTFEIFVVDRKGQSASLPVPKDDYLETLRAIQSRAASAPGKDCILLTDKEVWIAAHLLPSLLPGNQRMQASAQPR